MPYKKKCACGNEFTVIRSLAKKCAGCKAKDWYIKNRQRAIATRKEYREKNWEKCQELRNSWKSKNVEREKLNNTNWYLNNKKKHAVYSKQRKREREQYDINFKLKNRLRHRLYMGLTNKYKYISAIKDLGCSIPDLKKHLESKFQPGMSWDNYGSGWHVDHIKPLAKFNLSNKKQQIYAFHYTNLQPLWAKDNLKKGAK